MANVVLYDSTGALLSTASTAPPAASSLALVTKAINAPLYQEFLNNTALVATSDIFLHGIAHDTVTAFCRVRSGSATSVTFKLAEAYPGTASTSEVTGLQATMNIPSADFSTTKYRLLTLKGLRTTSVLAEVTMAGTQSATVDFIIMGKSQVLKEPPTFLAIFDRIVPAQNKYMATLFNPNTRQVFAVRRIWASNWQVAAVTGVILEQYLARITARTVGTTITPQPVDEADNMTIEAVADHNSTPVTEDYIFKRFFHVSEEVVLASTGLTLNMAGDRDFQLIYEAVQGMKPITLRNSEGISVRNVTNSTAGTCSYVIEFTLES